MDIIQIIGIGTITAVLSFVIKQYRPEMAIVLPVLGASLIFLYVAPYLENVISMFSDIADKAGIESRYLKTIIKMIGIAYLCQFSAELCRSAGEVLIAGKIELGGKLIILSLSIPIIYNLLELVSSIIYFRV